MTVLPKSAWKEFGWPMRLDVLNDMPAEIFVDSVGWVFEHSPWVARRAAAGRPFADVEALHRAMARQVDIASPDEQLALLRAHPDLGTRAKLGDASAGEQAGAGLGQLTPEEFELFARGNRSYTLKFGFPFLYAVKGASKHEILLALGKRLHASREEEFAAALRQVYRIATFRLEDYLRAEE